MVGVIYYCVHCIGSLHWLVGILRRITMYGVGVAERCSVELMII